MSEAGKVQVIRVLGNSFVRFHIKDLLSATQFGRVYNTRGYEFSQIFVSGLVTSSSTLKASGNIILIVEDATGAIECVMLNQSKNSEWRPQQNRTQTYETSQPSTSQPSTSQQPTAEPTVPQPGNYVRVHGRLNDYKDIRNIIVNRYEILKSYKDHLHDLKHLKHLYERAGVIPQSSDNLNL